MTTPARVLAVSDTHLGDGQADRLITRLGGLLDGLDAILHAGDVVHPGVLAALREHAPVHAVLGNNDHGLGLPEQAQFELGGRTVAMVHDSGSSAGRATRLRRWFPSADLVVFGHSHAPWHETHVDERGPCTAPPQPRLGDAAAGAAGVHGRVAVARSRRDRGRVRPGRMTDGGLG
jgi:putative phosphoesterase